MTVSGAAAEEWALRAKLDDLVRRIRSKVAEVERNINSKIGWLPQNVQAGVRTEWNKCTVALNGMWANIDRISLSLGSPSVLLRVANDWSDHVGGPVSGTVQQADLASLSVDDNWQGSAAAAYRQVTPTQKLALEKVKTIYTDGVSTALAEVAKGITIFYVAILAALATLVAACVAAAASSATILGLPAAPLILLAALVVAAAALAGGMYNLRSVCGAVNVTLRQKLNDNTAYPQGHWPAARVS